MADSKPTRVPNANGIFTDTTVAVPEGDAFYVTGVIYVYIGGTSGTPNI